MKLLLALLLLCSLGTAAGAAAPTLVILLLPGTSLRDWQNADAPNLHRLMQTGALAVMNTRSAHHAGDRQPETPESVLLTLGAGARAASAPSPSEFQPVSSEAAGMALEAGMLFERRTGVTPRLEQSVCLDWPATVEANRNPGYDLRLGSLTDTLAAHGIPVKSGGRPAADWIAANGDGTVRRSSTLQAMPGCCLFWDAGSNIEAADAVIGGASGQIKRLQGNLIVMSPFPSRAAYSRNERLTPVLLWGQGVPAGVLSSSSTHRTGLITDTDFAPSVAASFGIPRRAFRSQPFGFAWMPAAAGDNVRQVERLNDQSVQQADTMRLLPYLAASLAVWLLAVTVLMSTRQWADGLPLLPLAVWIAALFAVSPTVFAGLAAGLIGLTSVLVRCLGNSRTLTLLTGVATLSLSLDMVTGNTLMHRGMLGYSAIEGARYYGIGNEAMGLLLGASLVVVSRLWGTFPKSPIVLTVVMGVIIVLLGSAGAKAGGVLVSLAVFVTYLHSVSGRRGTLRTVATLAAVAVAVLAIAALGDAFLVPGDHSHIGEAVQRIASGGAGEAGDIIGRKLAVEGRLAYHSLWAVLLWIGVLCTGYIWKRTPALTPSENSLRSAGMVGVVSCLLLNDAGVVAAAIFATILWSEAVTQKQSLPARRMPRQGG